MIKYTDIENLIVQNNIKALIFDCDGTIMNTLEHHFAAWEYACSQLEQPFIKYPEFMTDYAGTSGAEMLEQLETKYGIKYNISKLIELKRKCFINEFINNVTPIEHVLKIALNYHGNLKLAVASGGAQEAVEKMLLMHNVRNLFDTVVTFDIVKVGKPSPDIFLYTAQHMHVSPEECLVFEDHHVGFQAATNANMLYIDINQLILD